MIVTKTGDGGLAIAAWNLVDPDKRGKTEEMDLEFEHARPDASLAIQRVDDEHGNVLKKYAAMGSPLDPTPDQVAELNRETALPPPEQMQLKQGKIRLTLKPNALLLIKVQP